MNEKDKEILRKNLTQRKEFHFAEKEQIKKDLDVITRINDVHLRISIEKNRRAEALTNEIIKLEEQLSKIDL